MADLIDRDALLSIYKGWIPQLTAPEDAGNRNGVENCIAVLQDEPTVDAVEVVRCKDCIGQSTWFKDAENGCEVCGMSGMYPKGTFDFCSYGERRKE